MLHFFSSLIQLNLHLHTFTSLNITSYQIHRFSKVEVNSYDHMNVKVKSRFRSLPCLKAWSTLFISKKLWLRIFYHLIIVLLHRLWRIHLFLLFVSVYILDEILFELILNSVFKLSQEWHTCLLGIFRFLHCYTVVLVRLYLFLTIIKKSFTYLDAYNFQK